VPAMGKAETTLRIEGGVDALVVGRGGREGDEVRHEARQSMCEVNGVVAAFHADVDVLAEHGEGLGQVAVAVLQEMKALVRRDALFAPFLERVRAAAGHVDVQAHGGRHDGVAQRLQFLDQGVGLGVDRRIQFDHALGDFELDLFLQGGRLDAGQQVERIGGEVVVAPVQELQFQLHAHGEGFRFAEGQDAHGVSSLFRCLYVTGLARLEQGELGGDRADDFEHQQAADDQRHEVDRGVRVDSRRARAKLVPPMATARAATTMITGSTR